MSLKLISCYVGCSAAWFVLLPVFVVGGGLFLFSYAVFTELGEFVIGGTQSALDGAKAREIAQRVCIGH